jgi:hypothetical protein
MSYRLTLRDASTFPPQSHTSLRTAEPEPSRRHTAFLDFTVRFGFPIASRSYPSLPSPTWERKPTTQRA